MSSADHSSFDEFKKSEAVIEKAIESCVPDSKKRTSDGETKSSLVIGTHSGRFHHDEALAVWLLRQLPAFKNADVVRTRDYKTLASLDIVVDVGGVYDPATLRFDHHQKGFDQCMGDGRSIKLSSAGLVWRHFGRQFVRQQLQERGDPNLAADDDRLVELVFKKLYESFVECVDAVDNGVMPFPGVTGKDALYQYHGTTLSSRVGHLNAAWNDPEANDDAAADRRFGEASDLCGKELLGAVHGLLDVWLPARHIVERTYDQRFQWHPSGKILNFTDYCPWQQHLFDIEEERGDQPTVLYAVIGDDAKGDVRVQAVPDAPGSFANRKPLPKAWCALRAQELQQMCGVPDANFVHAAGFTGGAKSRQGANQMAIKALDL